MKVALIHGWGLGSGVWSPVLNRLQEAFEVRTFDLPGYGSRLNETLPNSDSIEALADDALQRIPAGLIWVGWSLGAMVSIAAASERREHIAGLFLVSPTLQFCDQRGSDPVDELQASVDSNPAKALRRFALSLPASEHRRDLKTTLAELASEIPQKETLIGGLKILRRSDLSQHARGLDLPVHVIAGGSDQIIPVSQARKVHDSVRGSGIDELPCGHVPFLEYPDLFVERLVEFAKATF